MRFLLLLFSLITIYSTGFAQSNGKVSGKISTGTDQSAENATVLLLRAKDSVMMKTTLPDKNGAFEFEEVKPGSYLVSVSMVGFKKYTGSSFSIDEKNSAITISPITLLSAASQLGEVTVEAKKPFIERKLDRFIVNVENSIVGAGSTVLNVLERSPGVLVNEESGIKLRGKQGVIVMIDGKPSPLAGADLINYLKSVPSSAIEKIELITNPSAKYDAAGNAGIINIKFKKDQRQGLNGNFTLSDGQGRYNKPSAAVNLNYRKKKWNLFSNLSTSHPTNFTRFYINRKFSDNNGNIQSIFDQTSFIKTPFSSYNAKVGADYYASKKTVIGVMLNGNFFNHSRDGFTNSIITNPDGSLQYTTETDNVLSGSSNNMFGNFNLKHTFDSLGKELTVDADLGRYKSSTLQDFNNQYFDETGNPKTLDKLKTDQNGIINVKSIKADYLHPLKGNAKIEAGIKSSLVKTDSDIKFFTIDGSTVTIDATRSNHFIYKENVNAAYLNYAKEFKKTDIQFGLRMEHTVTDGKQLSTGESFSRNYVMLFPSFFINQKLSETHQLSFSYSRRIDRPSYRQLNPFRIFVDPYTYVVGDPALRPVSTHSFESNYTLKNKYIVTLSYSTSKASITDIFAQDDASKVSYQIPANIQDFEQYNLGVTIPVSIQKWMNSNIIASIYRNNYSSPLQGGQLVNNYTAWDVSMNNSFVIGKKGWAAELGGFYQSKNAWGMFLIKDLAQISAGIQKTTKDKKSTFKLAVTDIFYTNHIAVIVKYQNMDFHTDRRWDSRVATLSFTHRFGSTKVAQARRRTSGVEDEKRRAN